MSDSESNSEVNLDQPPAPSALDQKINEFFPGTVVRKDLVKAVRGNAVVPSYVLEFLLAQYAASDDEATIQAGIAAVRNILAKHYVNRNEHMLLKSMIREKGSYRIIDKVTVTLNEKQDVHEAAFENLQIKNVVIDDRIVKDNPKLLVGGVWCICDIEYYHESSSPWLLGSLKPIQVSGIDLEHYYRSRTSFSTEEWIDLLMQSIGLNPEQFDDRDKLIALTRLIPFVERNYNFVELGPKGTGKSHIFSEFSPNGILISGAEVTLAKLFVNNSTGRIGLVGYWDCVAFDEFAGNKSAKQDLVNVMKNYLANKSFSRGASVYGAEASMVFIGNTAHTVRYMLKNSDLFDELPDAYRDPAWLDRIHYYVPGWEVAPMRSEMFASGYGFVVDYLAEILRSQRATDYSDLYKEYFTLDSSLSTRDQDGIRKTFSGLMKIIHPTGQATEAEIRTLLEFAMEGRKRVKDSILRIDATMRDTPIEFRFADRAGNWHNVATREESRYPQLYHRDWDSEEDPEEEDTTEESVTSFVESVVVEDAAPVVAEELCDKVVDFYDGQRGVTYENCLIPYLKGATDIIITDPYIRKDYQYYNLVMLLCDLALVKDEKEEIDVTLVTVRDREDPDGQWERITGIIDAADEEGIRFNVEFATGLHDRGIKANNGWRIDMGRGLDMWEAPKIKRYGFGLFNRNFGVLKSNFTISYRHLSEEELLRLFP
ncbi:BREX system Lon protease-like protein BrxL [Corynebacterium sp. SCR221107]|uniref:BREX system Lon protease-like protein BrxL n=1 Tax=Corynebacterium sp. SCR221107 TaxID=3017361 RepID=UPI0022EC7ACC|nr:BREX system Lon protease-like protein BrxL [Corynebacterium sp. SCR221107]WBT09188.1 BREX system Lon protease-like protein BrxL [Corynebacterium sp. SCR221107]